MKIKYKCCCGAEGEFEDPTYTSHVNERAKEWLAAHKECPSRPAPNPPFNPYGVPTTYFSTTNKK